MCTLADKIITEILTDFKASKKYLDESQDTTSARARRCLNLVQNVEYLLERTPEMIVASAKITGTHGFFGIKGLSNVETL